MEWKMSYEIDQEENLYYNALKYAQQVTDDFGNIVHPVMPQYGIAVNFLKENVG
jgi:hypothetical protein